MGLVLFLIAGIGLLYVGAEALVRGSAGLALRLGLTPLVVGLTVVAFGTSSPELVVSLSAGARGDASLALANVVGSNVCNVALILGLAALVRPLGVRSQLVRLDVPLVIGCSVALSLLVADDALGRIEGGALAAALFGYVGFTLVQARREPPEVLEPEVAASSPDRSVAYLAGEAVVGLALLVGGAHLFVEGAVGVAEWLGASTTFIGLTVVALGTSLPELATSVVASFRGEGDIAVGNVVGSNLFNLLGIAGATALAFPIAGTGLERLDLLVMTGVVVLLLPMMWTRYRIGRIEGAVLLAVYVGYMAAIWP